MYARFSISDILVQKKTTKKSKTKISRSAGIVIKDQTNNIRKKTISENQKLGSHALKTKLVTNIPNDNKTMDTCTLIKVEASDVSQDANLTHECNLKISSSSNYIKKKIITETVISKSKHSRTNNRAKSSSMKKNSAKGRDDKVTHGKNFVLAKNDHLKNIKKEFEDKVTRLQTHSNLKKTNPKNRSTKILHEFSSGIEPGITNNLTNILQTETFGRMLHKDETFNKNKTTFNINLSLKANKIQCKKNTSGLTSNKIDALTCKPRISSSRKIKSVGRENSNKNSDKFNLQSISLKNSNNCNQDFKFIKKLYGNKLSVEDIVSNSAPKNSLFHPSTSEGTVSTPKSQECLKIKTEKELEYSTSQLNLINSCSSVVNDHSRGDKAKKCSSDVELAKNHCNFDATLVNIKTQPNDESLFQNSSGAVNQIEHFITKEIKKEIINGDHNRLKYYFDPNIHLTRQPSRMDQISGGTDPAAPSCSDYVDFKIVTEKACMKIKKSKSGVKRKVESSTIDLAQSSCKRISLSKISPTASGSTFEMTENEQEDSDIEVLSVIDNTLIKKCKTRIREFKRCPFALNDDFIPLSTISSKNTCRSSNITCQIMPADDKRDCKVSENVAETNLHSSTKIRGINDNKTAQIPVKIANSASNKSYRNSFAKEINNVKRHYKQIIMKMKEHEWNQMSIGCLINYEEIHIRLLSMHLDPYLLQNYVSKIHEELTNLESSDLDNVLVILYPNLKRITFSPPFGSLLYQSFFPIENLFIGGQGVSLRLAQKAASVCALSILYDLPLPSYCRWIGSNKVYAEPKPTPRSFQMENSAISTEKLLEESHVENMADDDEIIILYKGPNKNESKKSKGLATTKEMDHLKRNTLKHIASHGSAGTFMQHK